MVRAFGAHCHFRTMHRSKRQFEWRKAMDMTLANQDG